MNTTSGARRARLVAQAKINLSLRVIARDSGGYHQLETLFQRITLGDVVHLELTAGERTLDVSGADTGAVEQNLAWRAARAYAERAGWPRGWRIELEKRIPVGGGLGGGSADAGGVLRILDRLNPSPLGAPALLELAAGLGADVPFLTTELPLALAWGRGERMLALPVLPQRPVGLWIYPFGIATMDAFEWFAADCRGSSATYSRAGCIESGFRGWEEVFRYSVNDLEAPVFARKPTLASGLATLGSAVGDLRVLARMTGTGSTLFAIPLEQGPGWALPEPPSGVGKPHSITANTAVDVEEVELTE